MNNRVKMVREDLGLSQREFGEKLGVSRDVISNIESNRVELKELLLKHICEWYGVNEQRMRTGESMFASKAKNNKKYEEALSIFFALRPAYQNCALQQMKVLLNLQENMDASQ